MNTATITREMVEQVAAEKGLTVLEALTQMQTGAAAIDDEATLDRLCEIKSEILGL